LCAIPVARLGGRVAGGGDRHAGIADVVLEGKTGFLVDEGDVEAMAIPIVRLAREPDIVARLGAEAAARREFSMDRSLAGLWTLLRQVSDLRSESTMGLDASTRFAGPPDWYFSPTLVVAGTPPNAAEARTPVLRA
jgi:hypothetical protein